MTPQSFKEVRARLEAYTGYLGQQADIRFVFACYDALLAREAALVEGLRVFSEVAEQFDETKNTPRVSDNDSAYPYGLDVRDFRRARQLLNDPEAK